MSRGIIEEIRVFPLQIPLVQAFATSKAVQRTGHFVIVEVNADGLSGFGEADPRPHITGETIESVMLVLRKHLIPAVLGRSVFDLQGIHQAMDAIRLNPSAKSAIDIAVFDLLGKTLDLPLCALLGGQVRERISINAWCGIEKEPEAVLATLSGKVEQGFNHAAKIKVGVDYSRELELLALLADVLPKGMDLIIDANQAWSYTSAKKFLTQLTGSIVTIVEQPVCSDDIESMKKLTQSLPMAIMADESIWSASDAFQFAKMEAATMFNIKLLKCVGLHQAMKVASIAESAGIGCMIGSTVQTSISAAAQLHMAAACPVIGYADILIPNEFLIEDVADGICFERGTATPSLRPGLGLEINRKALEKYTLQEPDTLR